MYNYDGYNSANLNKVDERLIYYDWLADTATSSHVSNCLEAFTSFKPLKMRKLLVSEILLLKLKAGVLSNLNHKLTDKNSLSS